MKVVPRLLKPTPVESFDEYLALGGGGGLRAAEVLGAGAVLDELEASGLRGRGGAGFPTARKWRTVRANASLYERTSVVVNAAEGEPGTFKDRAVLRNDPYQVLEGALIAARVLDADQIVIATKHSFEREVARLTTAITEVRRRGWCEGVAVDLYEGPNEYLFGELHFVGNTVTYEDPRNSFLNEVLDRRTGIPITLALVYIEVARRAGVRVEGVNFPGHFLLR